jgi:hypothetical protein
MRRSIETPMRNILFALLASSAWPRSPLRPRAPSTSPGAATGNWSATSTWSRLRCPRRGQRDDRERHTVTIDVTAAACLSLTVRPGRLRHPPVLGHDRTHAHRGRRRSRSTRRDVPVGADRHVQTGHVLSLAAISRTTARSTSAPAATPRARASRSPAPRATRSRARAVPPTSARSRQQGHVIDRTCSRSRRAASPCWA